MKCAGYHIRWMIRTAYGIPGSECGDLATSVCCIPCSTNQLYQTASSYGNPTTDGGASQNTSPWANMNNGHQCSSCFYATCCNPCSIGTALNRSVGMPFWMGCCCVNICSARNIIRYQSRVRGDECWEEIVTPCAVYIGCVAGYFCPILYCCIAPAIIAQSMQLQAQADAKPSRTNRYLEPVHRPPPPTSGITMTYSSSSEHRGESAPGTFPSQQQVVYAYANPAQPQVVYAMPTSPTGQQQQVHYTYTQSEAPMQPPMQYAYAQPGTPGQPQMHYTYAQATLAPFPGSSVAYTQPSEVEPPPPYSPSAEATATPPPAPVNDSISKDEIK